MKRQFFVTNSGFRKLNNMETTVWECVVLGPV